MTVDQLLTEARADLDRLAPQDLAVAVAEGAVVVDIRPAAQRAAEGELPGTLIIERNVLEWRCDPTSDARIPEAVDHDVRWVVMCSAGYTSGNGSVVWPHRGGLIWPHIAGRHAAVAA